MKVLNDIFTKLLNYLVEFFLFIVKGFEFLGSKFTAFGSLYNNIFYKKMVAREIALGEIAKGSKVLHIGSGPYPMTAIALAQGGYEVVGVDNDPKAIRSGQRLVDKMGLSSLVKFKEIDALGIGYNDFDLIILSLHVIPKARTIEEIIEGLDKGTRVVYRNPRGLLSKIYPRVYPESLSLDINHTIRKQSFGKESVLIYKV
ncbi:class I SAM-dependent methyltransferase [Halonatronum saccharophilum]|uniref:class I SAM-dependent methyltransferase n=1 Tax=Halonatronum saccharophilum TaxID=150060 RepID=UPI0004838FDE|nr:nicotianamine synthase family protein [Halonatronum saccharophilum]